MNTKNHSAQATPRHLVGPVLYALYTPEGRLVRCEMRLAHVVNYLHASMPAELWNRVFDGSTADSIRAFREYGYRIVRGTFMPKTRSTGRGTWWIDAY
jgi:hypothetical protein